MSWYGTWRSWTRTRGYSQRLCWKTLAWLLSCFPVSTVSAGVLLYLSPCVGKHMLPFLPRRPGIPEDLRRSSPPLVGAGGARGAQGPFVGSHGHPVCPLAIAQREDRTHDRGDRGSINLSGNCVLGHPPIIRPATAGNPRFATTFRDEGFNGELAEMARASHRVQLEESVLLRAGLRGTAMPSERTRRRRLGH